MSIVAQVIHFNQVLLKIDRLSPKLLSDTEAEWLHRALVEETFEFTEAHSGQDLVGSVDALIDLIYFAIGGLYRLGLNEYKIEACFNTIHAANLRKKIGIKPNRPQDGSVADAIKMPDFITPEEDLKKILFESDPLNQYTSKPPRSE